MNMEKIKALLERAGHPLKLCTETGEPVIHETLEECVEEIVQDSTEIMDALASALEITLNEREQLMRDLHSVVTRHNSCECCVHDPYHSLDCYKCMTENRWTWRGVPEKEETP